VRLLIATALAAFLAASASLAAAETLQRDGLRVTLDGQISPQRLPREGLAPVAVTVGTEIAPASSGRPLAQLTRIEIAINRHGHLDPTGLPACELTDIQPATTEKALQECRGSLVGRGTFAAQVGLSRQASFPSGGELYAFNGTYKGQPAILAHVYGTEPVPTSFTLPFLIGKAKGAFATTLTATIPASEGNFVTAIELRLQRSFTYRGKRRSYASAGCPAPKGFPGAVFPFAKVSYAFAGGKKLAATLVRNCKAQG
jgi:hypothetical protein